MKLQVNLLKDVLTVPSTAVQNNYVYLVRPDGTVTQRRIRVGVADGDRVSVEGELQDGEQVVTDGIDRLREGAKVAVIDAAVATRADAAAQDAGARRAALMASLTPQEREQVAKMSQEERRAFFRNRRAQAPAGRKGRPAALRPLHRLHRLPGHPAPVLRPRRLRPRPRLPRADRSRAFPHRAAQAQLLPLPPLPLSP